MLRRVDERRLGRGHTGEQLQRGEKRENCVEDGIGGLGRVDSNSDGLGMANAFGGGRAGWGGGNALKPG